MPGDLRQDSPGTGPDGTASAGTCPPGEGCRGPASPGGYLEGSGTTGHGRLGRQADIGRYRRQRRRE